MRHLYKKFKQLTGRRGTDLAEANQFSRQYVSLMLSHPSPSYDRRIGAMMITEIEKVIVEKEIEIQELLKLQREIAKEGKVYETA